ncbi:hypothetical protein K3148_03645 [Qipengyuania aurantiaca]|uniref:Zinc ribbon domain-containing protein n=1 Tax=Qipengyuania aurantiaca TaxID=2867233 RepID=A0ABX8ZTM0_9SPHN|nr:hypothetical protein [Qipengyuania aurantiaca]QZD90498.1 hypothetical protein K3148_03645 [Qipengyuania aurantiaca]
MGGIPDTREGRPDLSGLEAPATAEPVERVERASLRAPFGFWRAYGYTVSAVILLWLAFATLIGGWFFGAFTTIFLFGMIVSPRQRLRAGRRDDYTGSIYEALGENFVSSACPDCGASIFGPAQLTWYRSAPTSRFLFPARNCSDCGYDLTTHAQTD